MHIKANGIDVHYTIDGVTNTASDKDKPWVVLSHSLACDLSMWDNEVKLLSQHYRVMRYDTRGHGKTSATAGAYSMDLLTDDAKALLRDLMNKDAQVDADQINRVQATISNWKNDLVLPGQALSHAADEDELFLVLGGTLRMKFRQHGVEREEKVREGEFIIVPRGVEHMPVADEEVHVMLLEPKLT